MREITLILIFLTLAHIININFVLTKIKLFPLHTLLVRWYEKTTEQIKFPFSIIYLTLTFLPILFDILVFYIIEFWLLIWGKIKMYFLRQ